MATTLLKLTTILPLITPLFLALHSQRVLSTDIDDDEEYVVDTPFLNARPRSRFLASIKKGAHCNPITKNICNGISTNNGISLLRCCKTHLPQTFLEIGITVGGVCENKCKLGELCCHGTCTNVAYNVTYCGKCNNKCSPGLKCEYGSCGYA